MNKIKSLWDAIHPLYQGAVVGLFVGGIATGIITWALCL